MHVIDALFGSQIIPFRVWASSDRLLGACHINIETSLSTIIIIIKLGTVLNSF